MQESTLRDISRELHDEFGQILTAVGSLLGRAEKHAPEGSPLRGELRAVSQIAQNTLDNVRSLSQALHPVMLDELGLEAAVEWYVATIAKQTGVAVSYEKSGTPFPVEASAAIHVYRVLQESFNNVVRHSGAREAFIRVEFQTDALQLEVEDRGRGFHQNGNRQGIGLVAMRERAQLLGGTLDWLQPDGGGTLVRLRVPRLRCAAHAG
jgi:signal transduction histidine kinase